MLILPYFCKINTKVKIQTRSKNLKLRVEVPWLEKSEIFKKGWNFASPSCFVSCIMKKHHFFSWLHGGKKLRVFSLFSLWNKVLQRWSIWMRIQLWFLTEHFYIFTRNQTSKEQDLNFTAATFILEAAVERCSESHVMPTTFLYIHFLIFWSHFFDLF